MEPIRTDLAVERTAAAPSLPGGHTGNPRERLFRHRDPHQE